jgi:uncharacterized protein
MPRKFLRRYMPSADKVREIKAFGVFGDSLFHPALWHLNRHSAAGGVATGLFCGLIPGPLQALCGLVACLWIRSNLPLTIITTFYTNPLTIAPLYLVAYEYGRLLFPGARAVPPAFHPPADAGITGFLPGWCCSP